MPFNLLLPILLQVHTDHPVLLEDMPAGSKLIGSLLAAIFALLIYIWQDNKKNAEKKHNDIIMVIAKMDDRVEKVEDWQIEHGLEMVALRAVVNIMQGKPFDYDNANNHKKHER